MKVVVPGFSLNALVFEARARFYRQSWYEREPFACHVWSQEFVLPASFKPFDEPPIRQHLLPAVAWAQAYLQGDAPILQDHYVWTSDTDHNGDPVYVGMAAEYPGLQVHRHLTITQKWVA